MTDAYVLDAVRTPIGRYGGALARRPPRRPRRPRRARRCVDRAPTLDPARIDDVCFGDANGAGEDNRNVARMAVLLAGLPTSRPRRDASTGCAARASRPSIAGLPGRSQSATPSLVLAGGVESMSRAPWVLLKPDQGFPAGHETLHSTTLGWRMVNPAMPERSGRSRSARAPRCWPTRTRSRARTQDAFALRSHQRAAAAWDDGVYDDQVVPSPAPSSTRDEGIRPDTSLEALAKLEPAFRADGTVTAGNASPLNDGAGALLVGDEARGQAGGPRAAGPDRRPRRPRRRPRRLRHRPGRGRQQGAARAPASAGATWTSSSSTRRSRRSRWPAWPSGPSSTPRSSTRNGGAIAHRPPARLLGRAHPRHAGARSCTAAAAATAWPRICIGVGQGLAVVLEA